MSISLPSSRKFSVPAPPWPRADRRCPIPRSPSGRSPCPCGCGWPARPRPRSPRCRGQRSVSRAGTLISGRVDRPNAQQYIQKAAALPTMRSAADAAGEVGSLVQPAHQRVVPVLLGGKALPRRQAAQVYSSLFSSSAFACSRSLFIRVLLF